MFNRPLCLRDFSELAPVCDQAAGMKAVFGLFQQGNCDRVVIVNHQQQPVGIVHLRNLAPDWGGNSWLDQPIDLAQPVTAWGAPWVQPLPTLPAELPLAQSLPYLESNSRFWALMDQNRKFQGLLDSFHIQKFCQYLTARDAQFDLQPLTSLLAKQKAITPTFPQSMSRRPLGVSQRIDWAGTREGADPDVNRLKAQLRIQMARLRSQLQAKQVLANPVTLPPHGNLSVETPDQLEAATLATLEPQSVHKANPAITALIKFVECLPLPLMLQTEAGEVVAQNYVWLEQFGDLVDPGWVRRDAAALLESQPIAPRQWQDVATGWQQPISPNPAPSLCEIGESPNTCICVCPLKNGQERMVQFIKVPLGGALSGLEDTLAMGQASSLQGSDRFRLAKLEPIISESDLGVRSNSKILASQASNFWLVLAQDVTEQQQLTKELAAKNADLVQLNRLKDEFLACISHELRTPLTAVLGLSSLLKDQTLGALNERQVRYAQLIYRSGRHLMAIVNDILDLTRMETGQVELTLEQLPIATICDRALEQAKQLRLMEAKPDIQQAEGDLLPTPSFTLEIEPGLESIVADEQRLLQMLVNLLSNALKFTEATGQVGLRINRWDGWVALTVWDTGIGIPADKQHLIFQKFQQLENPLTRRFEGAGLGLLLTQRLARLHGGDVTFVSKEHQGSEFTLLLPPIPNLDREAIDATTPSRLNARKPQPPIRLVLIVEALIGVIEALTTQLSDLGYRVVIARSGTEALEKTRRLQPCAVFLNPLLPMLSGWDVLTLLKADDETRHIPVIITGTGVDQAQADRNHADGCLTVPIARPALQHVLTQVALLSESAPMPNGRGFVVLRLSPNRHPTHQAETQLNALLHQHNYRVLEVDDLEQADLLARVWQPRVTILSGTLSEPVAYLQYLASFSELAALPLITLDHLTTEAANQVPGLLVFPCLVSLMEQVTPSPVETSALLQVIEIAAGNLAKPDR